MNTEIWKSIPNYDKYQISSFGKVKSLKGKEKVLKTHINMFGYETVILCNNGKAKGFKVHQLVAIAFLNHIPNGHTLVINHKDGIRHNNKVENLEIISQRSNTSKSQIKSSSGCVGVSWNKVTKRFVAQIQIKGKIKYLMSSKNECDCCRAYQRAVSSLL